MRSLPRAAAIAGALAFLAGSPALGSSPAGSQDPPGAVRVSGLAPTSLVDEAGSHAGSVAALATRDQSGTQDDPSTYVLLRGDEDAYSGYRSYVLPSGVTPSAVTTITLAANVRGPTARANAWTWSVYDWADGTWVRLGDQNHCGGDRGTDQWSCDDLDRKPWKYVQVNAIHESGASLADFVDAATGELRIRLASSAPGVARLDWESLDIYWNTGEVVMPWQPPLSTRWQWQLEGAAGRHEATGGINVGICRPAASGGPCVRPDLFDIDLYVDPQIAGRFGYVIDAPAVDAIHDSGRHAIGYVTAGDAERWRPDYEQFVDFDRRCGGCFLGNPFSSRFPDEYWINLGGDHGQLDFMLQMMRARTDRVAAAGFDGIEYDIVDAYAQGRSVTGWRIGYATQLAYDIALAEMAHADGLSAALKNDGGQIVDLVAHFDYAINEQCFQYDECDGGGYPAPAWRTFVNAGKAVFQAEYRIDLVEFCSTANEWDFNSIAKGRDFSLYAKPWTPCR